MRRVGWALVAAGLLVATMNVGAAGALTPTTTYGFGSYCPGALGVHFVGTCGARTRPRRVFIPGTKHVAFGDASVVSTGSDNVDVIRTDGTLWTWGNGEYGELGTGPTDGIQANPVQVGTDTDWKTVAAGQFFSIAIKTDGTLWAWGDNTDGTLGTGDTTDHDTPVQIGTATDWATVDVGTDHVLALQTNGSLWAWGQNGAGELGDGTQTSRKSPRRIAVGRHFSAIAAGDAHSLALGRDGTLWVWGANEYGELGLGDTSLRTVPTQVGSDAWKSVSAGYAFSLAIRADGTLWAWGSNNDGDLGTGDQIQHHAPVQVGTATTWRRVDAAFQSGSAVKRNGTAWVWGDNGSGQLGTGDYTQRLEPVRYGANEHWRAVVGGPRGGLELTNAVVAVATDGTIWSTGAGELLGNPEFPKARTPVALDSFAGVSWKAISTDKLVGNLGPSGFTLGIESDGSLWSWGNNDAGELGTGYPHSYARIPTRVGSATDWSAISAGGSHAMAIKTDGTLWAWGSDLGCQLGIGSPCPNESTPVQVGSDTDWLTVSAGQNFTTAIKTDGSLWAWGTNERGQLGAGPSVTSAITPIQIGAATTWSTVASGYDFTIALRTDGSMWAWGDDYNGQLGVGDNNFRTKPTHVGNATNWATVSVGSDNSQFALATKTDGTLWSWGSNDGYQLGDSGDGRNAPAQVGTDDTWASVSAGYSHAAATKTDGTLWTWGDNNFGELGVPGAFFPTAPIQVGTDTTWTTAVAGSYFTLALRE